MTQDPLMTKLSEIDGLLSERLHLRGRTFADKVRRARRHLPRRVSREAAYLAQVEQMAQAPKLARQIDETRLETALRLVGDHLKTIDRRERMKDRLLSILGIVAVNILLVGGITVYVLWKRGIV